MGKKNKYHKDLDLRVDKPEQAPSEEESILESEAYAKPETDKDMETTVLKPLGKGGPVPIIAPKGNTIQLQPIIVPLAVVPYMTQDSEILRTDSSRMNQLTGKDYAEAESYSPPDFEGVAYEKKKKRGAKPRIFAAAIFLVSALVVIPYIIAYFYHDIGYKIYLFDINIINAIKQWAAGTAPSDIPAQLLNIICAGFALISALIALLSLIIGKFPKVPLAVTSLFSAVSVISLLIYKLVENTFDMKYDSIIIVVIAFAVLSFIFSVVFSFVLENSLKKEKINDSLI